MNKNNAIHNRITLEQIALIITMQSSHRITTIVPVLVNSKKSAFSLALILKLSLVRTLKFFIKP